jgi:hypothetical protein
VASNPTTQGASIAATADSLSAAFARELGKLLIDATAALRPLLKQAIAGDRTATIAAARGIKLRTAIRQTLTAAGYDALAEEAALAAVERMSEAVLATRVGRGTAGLVKPNGRTLAALAEVGRANLLQQADDVAAALWRSLGQVLFTSRPVDAVLEDLLDVFEDEVGNLQTLFDTQVSIYGRQVEALATADLEADQPYLYAGPVDLKTRTWCLERVGKVYTRAEIDAMDNGALPDAFLTGGGYNCRHSFLAVESDEARGLLGTGQRLPEIAARVEFVEATKAARKRKAA